MRKSLAPSQIAKRQQDQTAKDNDADLHPLKKKSKVFKPTRQETCMSPFRKPLASLSNHSVMKKRVVSKPGSVCNFNSSQKFPDHNSHEEFIRKILSKPFKLPIVNYKGTLLAGRGLGIRKQLLRKPLHDPFEENALVLYSPPEISAHDAIKLDKTKIPVHVVVDPVLAKVYLMYVGCYL